MADGKSTPTRSGVDVPARASDRLPVFIEIPSPQRVETPAPTPAKGGSRICWVATLGALWSTVFFLMIVLSTIRVNVKVKPDSAEPMWHLILTSVILPLGWAAPFATTALGLIAIKRIQRANGAKYGLSLALFDALLYPLLVVDLMIFWIGWQMADALVDHELLTQQFASLSLRQIIPAAACVLADYLLTRMSWNSLNAPR